MSIFSSFPDTKNLLQVDNNEPILGKAGGRSKSLNIRGSVFLGGHPYPYGRQIENTKDKIGLQAL